MENPFDEEFMAEIYRAIDQTIEEWRYNEAPAAVANQTLTQGT